MADFNGEEVMSEHQSKTFCVRPFIGLEISNDGSLSPCCDYNRHYDNVSVQNNNIEGVLQGPEARELKRKLLNSEYPEKCQACWSNEKNGLYSQRQRSNHEYKHLIPLINDVEYSDIQALDLKLGIVCNQMCIICNSQSSSMLRNEDIALFNIDSNITDWTRNIDSWVKVDKLFEDNNVTKLDIYGGEPWLSKQHFALIQRLIDNGMSKNITLSYATNGSVMSDEILNMFDNFKKVNILFSGDGIREVFEYTRHPAKWDVFQHNLVTLHRAMKQQPHNFMSIAYTVSFHSVFDIKRSLEFYSNSGITTWLNPVNEPWFSVKSMPQELKQQAIEMLQSIDESRVLIQGDSIQSIINLINEPAAEDWHWDHGVDITRKRDGMRNKPIANVISQFKGYI